MGFVGEMKEVGVIGIIRLWRVWLYLEMGEFRILEGIGFCFGCL